MAVDPDQIPIGKPSSRCGYEIPEESRMLIMPAGTDGIGGSLTAALYSKCQRPLLKYLCTKFWCKGTWCAILGYISLPTMPLTVSGGRGFVIRRLDGS